MYFVFMEESLKESNELLQSLIPKIDGIIFRKRGLVIGKSSARVVDGSFYSEPFLPFPDTCDVADSIDLIAGEKVVMSFTTNVVLGNGVNITNITSFKLNPLS